MKKKFLYTAIIVAGLLGAGIAGLVLNYGLPAVQLMAALGIDAAYEKLFENTPEQDSRYTSDAVAQKDIRLCRKVSTRFVHSVMPRQTCYREVIAAAGEPALCTSEEIVEYIGEEYCYALLAGATGDESFCLRISSSEASSAYDDCYQELALKHNDTRYCLKLTEDWQQESCLASTAAKKEYDSAGGQQAVLPK